MHQIGTPVRLLRTFCIEDRPIMHTGQVVHIMGSNHESHDCLYVVTDGSYCFLASQEDFSLLPGRAEGIEKSVEKRIEDAFKAGCQKGYECGFLSMNPDLFKAKVQVETWNYMRELKNEPGL